MTMLDNLTFVLLFGVIFFGSSSAQTTCNVWNGGIANSAMPGGTVVPTELTVGSCQSFCINTINTPACVAINFDISNPNSPVCTILTAFSPLGLSLLTTPSVTYYELNRNCVTRQCTYWDGGTNNIHYLGGTNISAYLDVHGCIAACTSNPSCNGVDYSYGNGGTVCWLILTTQLQWATIDGVIHFTPSRQYDCTAITGSTNVPSNATTGSTNVPTTMTGTTTSTTPGPPGIAVTGSTNVPTTTTTGTTKSTTPGPPGSAVSTTTATPTTSTTAVTPYYGSSEGYSFTIAFPAELPASTASQAIQLVICTTSSSIVNVKLTSMDPSTNYTWQTTVSNAACGNVAIPNSLRLVSPGLSPSKYLQVDSSYPVNVKVLLFGSCSGYASLPESSLGTLYYVATLSPSVSDLAFIAITATQDGTTVNINYYTTATATLQCGTTTSGCKQTTLNNGDTFLVTSTQDISGTNITASQPVAVVSGNTNQNGNYIANQLLPVSLWGSGASTYIVPQLFPPSSSSIPFNTKVISQTAGVRFLVSGTQYNMSSTSNSLTLPSFSQTLIITANQPLEVVQSIYTIAVLIPSTAQYRSEYDFFIPSVTQLAGNSYFIILMIVTSAKDGVQLDGAPLTNNTVIWQASSNGGAYSTAILPVSVGGHILKHTGGVMFGAILYTTNSNGGCTFGYALAFGPPTSQQTTATSAFTIKPAYIVLIGMGGALILMVIIAIVIICNYPLSDVKVTRKLKVSKPKRKSIRTFEAQAPPQPGELADVERNPYFDRNTTMETNEAIAESDRYPDHHEIANNHANHKQNGDAHELKEIEQDEESDIQSNKGLDSDKAEYFNSGQDTLENEF